ncbi:MAG: YhbY family RNA-binding protein [Gammaproteobacteria bacterium]|jgi:RNA-binding protein|nr:YhbY family RNA-binding protein [Candidatus Thioaporhodococcus sediminis]TNF55104.1 MAG: YhbY family RNA-binding protein [Gammaproteobacteria bacterium]
MRPTEQQKRWLKKQVHHLKPVVSLGQAGLTEAVLAEIELALDHHELIKVKIAAGDRALRDAFIAAIASRTQADLIDRIGNTAAFFRANPRKKAPLDLSAAT